MELWDAYDENFRKIEGMTLVRGQEKDIPQGVYHIVVDILVQHTDGEYLLMRRSPEKAFPGMWEASAGGSVLQGESAYDGAMRELFEETGVRAEKLVELGHIVSTKYPVIYADFLCVTDCAKDGIVLQQGETDAWRWVSKETLLSLDKTELVSDRVFSFVEELRRGKTSDPA